MATDSLRKTQCEVPEALFEGNRLDQPTFHRLYEQAPAGFKAELIGGVVHVASPVGMFHSDCHFLTVTWLGTYAASIPEVRPMLDATVILGDESEPQPDAALRYERGTSQVSDEGYCVGPPELAVEVSHSTAKQDLVHKRADYERFGVSEYLVLVVRKSQAVWFSREQESGFIEIVPEEGVLKSRRFPGLWLDTEALFQVDYGRVLAVLDEGLASR